MKFSSLRALFRLSAMRRRAGASLPSALAWAAGLLWRDRQVSQRRAEVERAVRQRL